jgi:hypothetical protein
MPLRTMLSSFRRIGHLTRSIIPRRKQAHFEPRKPSGFTVIVSPSRDPAGAHSYDELKLPDDELN